jgi:hypothetical protein
MWAEARLSEECQLAWENHGLVVLSTSDELLPWYLYLMSEKMVSSGLARNQSIAADSSALER